MSALSNLGTTTLHFFSSQLTRKGTQALERASLDVATTQRNILKDTLALVEGTQSGQKHAVHAAMTMEEFRRQVPITDYDYWHDMIVSQREHNKPLLTSAECERYQPTSGSTSSIKWIPYTRPFLNQLDEAISPWMADLYMHFPRIKRGRHYWSLSWVPSDLREQVGDAINDDLKLLPWWKRIFMAGTMAVPEGVSMASSSDESFFATSCYLMSCTELSFISVWSPTFAISLLQQMQDNRKAIADVLESGQWVAPYQTLSFLTAPKNPKVAKLLRDWDGEVTPEFTKLIWPNLGLISCWDTSSSKGWADQLRKLFPHSGFQGKGLFATEGVVTIPLGDQYPLAITSHFYEFEDLDNGDILCAWELKEGMRVRPIITTANGLLRYATKDQLHVTGFINQCPCLTFISRIDGVDMVGEKLSPDSAVNILNSFTGVSELAPVSLLALPASEGRAKPRYALLSNGSVISKAQNAELNQKLEDELCQHFHYKLARELGQLDAAQVIIADNAMDIYTGHKIAGGMVAGNIKLEPLVLWQGGQLPEALEQVSAKPEAGKVS
ncbi:MAG: GH3 auxin-responsive promoter family protein [Oleibacter sp.]|nr:GH3 auxin-responsive promoter family protein [Thalassolituus sp.]